MENERQELDERHAVLAGTWTTFGANVRRLRKARGWTQLHLAEQLNAYGVDLHQTTIAKVEGGTRPTVLHEIWALASVFGVGLDVLFPPIAADYTSRDSRGSELLRRRDDLHMRLAEANNEAHRIEEKRQVLQQELQTCLHELADFGMVTDEEAAVRLVARVHDESTGEADDGVDQEEV